MTYKDFKDKNIPSIRLESSLGLRTDIQDNICYFSSDKCAYLSGNYLVILLIKEKYQYFYPAKNNYGEITSFSVDEKGDVIIIAIAQKGKDKNFDNKSDLDVDKKYKLNSSFGTNINNEAIANYNYNKDNIISIKILNKNELGNDNATIKDISLIPELERKEDYFTSISINISKGLIIACFGSISPGVLVSSYDNKTNSVKLLKGERLDSVRNYKQVTINPYNPNMYAALAERAFKVFVINDTDKTTSNYEINSNSNCNEFKEVPFNFISLCWINKTRLAIVNTTCDLFVFDFIKKLDNPIKKVYKSSLLFENQSIAKSVFSKHGNIYVVKEDGYIVKLEQKYNLDINNLNNINSNNVLQANNKQINYDIIPAPKFISNLPRMEVIAACVNNPANQYGSFNGVLISTVSGQLYHIDITNDLNLNDGSNFKFLVNEFHSEEIVAIDIAKLKPLIATACKDRYIRIWNYKTSPIQLELKSEQFDEDLTHVAFHPNGLHIAVLFKDSCKLFHLNDYNITSYKEVLKISLPQDLKFSNYGHMFSICYKNYFIIYDFFTLEVKFNSKNIQEVNHTENITCFTWDSGTSSNLLSGIGSYNNTITSICDFNFGTCSLDGKAFYWDINNISQPLYGYINKEKKLYGVNYYKCNDTSGSNNSDTKIVFYLMDDNSVFEADAVSIDKRDNKFVLCNNDSNNKKEIKVRHKTILNEEFIKQFYYDNDSKLMITAKAREHFPTIRIFKVNNTPINQVGNNNNNNNTLTNNVTSNTTNNNLIHIKGSAVEIKEIENIYQSHSSGFNAFKINSKLTHLFTVGRDKSLMIFRLLGINKSEKREDIREFDLVLKDKRLLDEEIKELNNKIKQIEDEIVTDAETANKKRKEYNIEIENLSNQLNSDKIKYNNELNKLQELIDIKTQEFNKGCLNKKQEQDNKINELYIEHTLSIEKKEKEEEKESTTLNTAQINYHLVESKQIKQYNDEKEEIEKSFAEKLIKLKNSNSQKEHLKNKLNAELISKKELEMKENDIAITKRRYELERLRIVYDNIEDDFKIQKDTLIEDIHKKKTEVKHLEDNKNTDRNKLIDIQNENDKLAKNIRELSEERKDKLQTVLEKQNIERELFKENQELEKFKFVLNYKIKELQHEKDPKENKLQQLEKQAKDMDREIKNFEFSQRNYLIELTTNNEIMNLYKKQIVECESRIDKLRKYKKLFKEALYQASLKANNFKQLKKRIVELKRWFLDKEHIEELEKKSDDSDYDKQRDFLEENNKNDKEKILSTQKLFNQDHQKLMRENMNLIKIVNELKREHNEISLLTSNNKTNIISNLYIKDSNLNDIKEEEDKKNNYKSNNIGSSLHQKEKILMRELLEVEKKIQVINILKNKERKEKEEKDKIEKKDFKKKQFETIKNKKDLV